MAYSVRSRHKLLFNDKNGKKHLGDVMTLTDSSDIKIACDLLINATVKYEQYKSYKDCRSFYLMAPHEKEIGGEISKIVGFLKGSPHKAMLVFFDSKGSSCLLGLMEPFEESAFGGRGFKCYIVDHKAPMLPPAQLAPPVPVVNQQVQAATH